MSRCEHVQDAMQTVTTDSVVQACLFIAEIFSKICIPVKLEILAKNMWKICEICCDRMFAINWHA